MSGTHHSPFSFFLFLFVLVTSCKWNHWHLFFYGCIISLSIVFMCKIFFLFKADNIPLNIYTTYCLSICWWTLSLLPLLAIKNNAAMNMNVQMPIQVSFQKLLDHMIILWFFWGTSILSFEELWFLPPFLRSFLDSSSPTGYKVISHYGFECCFPNDSWCWAPFHVLVGHLYIFSCCH